MQENLFEKDNKQTIDLFGYSKPKNRQCKACLEILPINKFYYNKRDKHYVSYCNKCRCKDLSTRQKTKRVTSFSYRAAELYYQSKSRAKRKKMSFNLDKNWIYKKIKNGKCELSGIEFNILQTENKHNFNAFSPSVDRIDSKKGYTKDNCRVVCVIYNFFKNVFSDEDVDTAVFTLCENKIKGYLQEKIDEEIAEFKDMIDLEIGKGIEDGLEERTKEMREKYHIVLQVTTWHYEKKISNLMRMYGISAN